MANRLRQTVQSIEGTPAEQRMDMGGPAPDLTRVLAGGLQSIAEMLPGSGFVTGVKEGGSKGGLDVLAELIGLAGGAIGTVAGPPGTIGGYALGKGGVKAAAKLAKNIFPKPENIYKTPVYHSTKTSKENALEGTEEVTKQVERAKLFQDLANKQRGTPEIAMVEAQGKLGGGVLSHAIEHVGDLTHRMTDKYDDFKGYGYDVGNKVNKVLRSLRSEYGFEKEFNENIRNNASYKGISENRLRDTTTKALQRYADAHKNLRVYNEPQKLARDAAVALGEQRFKDAEELLSKLQNLIKGKGVTAQSGENISYTYRRAAGEFDPEFEKTIKNKKTTAKKSSILNKMEECVENIGGYANCQLAAQLTSDTTDFSKLKTINISEEDKIVTEFFDSGTINNLTKNLEKGDILNFNERHYSVYSGNGKVVQVPEWGGKAEEVPLIDVLKEYNPPTNIYKAEKIKAKKKQGGSVVERNPYANYQPKAI